MTEDDLKEQSNDTGNEGDVGRRTEEERITGRNKRPSDKDQVQSCEKAGEASSQEMEELSTSTVRGKYSKKKRSNDYQVVDLDEDVTSPPPAHTATSPLFKDQARERREHVDSREKVAVVEKRGPEYKDQVRSNSPDVHEGQESPMQMVGLCDTVTAEEVLQDDVPLFDDQVRVRTPNAPGIIMADALLLDTSSLPMEDDHVLPAHVIPISLGTEFNRRRTKTRVMIGAVVLLLIYAAAIGGICGSGYCSGRSGGERFGDLKNDTTVTADNYTVVPTEHLTKAPTTTAPTTLLTSAPTTSPTTLPSAAPITTAAETIVGFITSITKSERSISYPPSSEPSAEELAVQWLIEEDSMVLSLETEKDRARLVQRYALLTFYYSTEGPSWTASDGWLGAEDECTWFGISCEQSLVRRIILQGNNLNGTFPPDLALLQSLTTLGLWDNVDFGGSLPFAIGDLTNLQHFNVRNCGMSSSLPERAIGRWSNLVSFSAGDNALTGPLPRVIGNWSNLVTFDVAGSEFTGTLPDFGQLSNLETFFVFSNSLNGTLPAILGNWTSMQSFNVWGNDFTGTIPDSVLAWENVMGAFFFANRFVGTMPFCSENSTLSFPSGPNNNLYADCDEIECDCCTACF